LRYILICCFSFIACTQTIAASAHIGADSVGFYIEDISTGEIIASRNADMPFIPASVTKLVTTSTLLLNHSPIGRFTTAVMAEGTITDTVLHGNIVINASGDATIDSRFYDTNYGFVDSIICRLNSLNIREITGSVKIFTPSCFTNTAPNGWMEEDFVWPYGAVLHGLNYADNEYNLEFSTMKTIPMVPGLKIVRNNKRNGPKYFMARNSSLITLNRRAQKRGKTTFANPNPEGTLVNIIIEKCKDAGIKFVGKEISVSGGLKSDTIYNHTSPFFREIMDVTLKRSHNLMAESMLQAAYPGCSRQTAVNEELKLWHKLGLDTNSIFLEDGSGLSRNNRITPKFLAGVLRYINDTEYSDLFVNSLPVSCVSGTMKKFTSTPHLYGRLALKTGSMRKVQCYAGYYLDEFGNPSHIVVVMLNGVTASRDVIKSQVEKLILQNLY
nr:D-alanyl-D-alanine carboxypeptidase [Paramuribaculum sp.]